MFCNATHHLPTLVFHDGVDDEGRQDYVNVFQGGIERKQNESEAAISIAIRGGK